MVKTANIGSGPGGSRACLDREKRIYGFLSDSAAPRTNRYIRSCYDFAGNWNSEDVNVSDHAPCLILEWMDCELGRVPYQDLRERPNLIRTIARSVLSALVIFSEILGKTHMGQSSGS